MNLGRRGYGILAAAIFSLLLLLFLYSIAEVLLLFFIGVLLSLYLGGITDTLQRRLSVPRGLGLAIAVLFTLGAFVGIVFLLIPPVTEQIQQLVTTLPAQIQSWELQLRAMALRNRALGELLKPLDTGNGSYAGAILQQLGGYFRGFVPYVFGGVQVVVSFVGIFVIGIYMALRPAMYREGFILLAPPVHRELVRDILSDLGRTLRAYIVGQLMSMTILGLLTWFGLMLLGVPFALAFGVFTGAVTVIPFFGSLFSTLLPALIVLGSGGIVKCLAVVGLGVLVHLIEGNLVGPMIMERQVQLPPVLTMLSALIMGHLLGIIGLLVAVPMLATTMVVVRRIYVYRVLEGKGFRRSIRDQPIELRLPGEGVLVNPQALDASIPSLLEQ
ncbi:MAG TPA: AI-2E family transporter [Longimicrobiales bacterium]